MKKIYFLLMLFILSSCQEKTVVSSYSPSILAPLDSKLVINGAFTYVFFPSKQAVFLKSSGTTSARDSSAWYSLVEGETFDGITSFRLVGWGSQHNNYLAIVFGKTANGADTLFTSIQSTRDFAIRAVQSFSQNAIPTEVQPLRTLLSPSLYVLANIDEIVQTSLAGVFNPNNTKYYRFKILNETDLVNQANMQIITVLPDGTRNIESFDLSFQSNVSDTISIYSFADFATTRLLLLGVAIDILNPQARMQFIQKEITHGGQAVEIPRLANELQANNRWNYSPINQIRISDGSLTPFVGKTWVVPDSGANFNPQNTEKWVIDDNNSLANVITTTPGAIKSDDYILNLTAENAIFLLESPEKVGVYNNLYAHFKPTSADTGEIIFGSTLQEVKNNINKAGKPIRDITKTTEKPLVASALEQRPAEWPTASGTSTAGRAGFKAYQVNNSIYVVGGYTNNYPLQSSVPRTPAGTSALPLIENTVYRIDNIDNASISGIQFVNTGQVLDSRGTPNFQQPTGAALRPLTPGGNSQLWLLGGAALETQKFSINALAPDLWRSTTIDGPGFDNRYYQEMSILSDQVILAGGTFSSTSGLDMNDAEVIGTYTNQVFGAPVSLQGVSSSWSQVTIAAEWTPRIQANIVTILNDYILIGGIALNGSGVRIGTNDVWISKNFGTNWTELNAGGTVATTSSVGAPPAPSGANLANQGRIPVTTYGGIIFALDPSNAGLFYSSDMGATWKKSPQILPTTALYGSEIIAYKGYLYVIGGTANVSVGLTTDTGFNKNVYRFKINF